MAIMPLDIKNQTFKKVLRGFDTEEVSAFLEMLANEVEKLITERKTLSDQNRHFEEEIGEYKKLDKSLRDALINAQESARRITEEAEAEKARMLEDAEQETQEIIENGKLESLKMEEDIESLRLEKNKFLLDLQKLLDEQENAIQSMRMKLDGILEEESVEDSESVPNVEINKVATRHSEGVEREPGDGGEAGVSVYEESAEVREPQISEETPSVDVEEEKPVEAVHVEEAGDEPERRAESEEEEEKEERLNAIPDGEMIESEGSPGEKESITGEEGSGEDESREVLVEDDISKKIDDFFDNFEKKTITKEEAQEEESSGGFTVLD
jgi:cell division initiation protein